RPKLGGMGSFEARKTRTSKLPMPPGRIGNALELTVPRRSFEWLPSLGVLTRTRRPEIQMSTHARRVGVVILTGSDTRQGG
ncbi:MAG TPA: hypothetical protein VOA88_18575, partial [Candidatus Dormibacteraeota bacterium]|nr:hypothetical protein [Candidatus Dormibacteraeota bacterium]